MPDILEQQDLAMWRQSRLGEYKFIRNTAILFSGNKKHRHFGKLQEFQMIFTISHACQRSNDGFGLHARR